MGVLTGMLGTSHGSSNAFPNESAFQPRFDSFPGDPDAPAAGQAGEAFVRGNCVKSIRTKGTKSAGGGTY